MDKAQLLTVTIDASRFAFRRPTTSRRPSGGIHAALMLPRTFDPPTPDVSCESRPGQVQLGLHRRRRRHGRRVRTTRVKVPAGVIEFVLKKHPLTVGLRPGGGGYLRSTNGCGEAGPAPIEKSARTRSRTDPALSTQSAACCARDLALGRDRGNGGFHDRQSLGSFRIMTFETAIDTAYAINTRTSARWER